MRDRKADKAAARESAEQAKAVARQSAEQAKAAAAFAQSPAGQARTAYAQGAGFFELMLVVGSTRGTVHWAGNASKHKRNSYTDVLSAVENEGWKLDHVGYVWVQTGEVSRSRALGSGEQTAVSGRTEAIYLFRRVETSESNSTPGSAIVA